MKKYTALKKLCLADKLLAEVVAAFGVIDCPNPLTKDALVAHFYLGKAIVKYQEEVAKEEG